MYGKLYITNAYMHTCTYTALLCFSRSIITYLEAVRVHTFGAFLCALHVGGPWPCPKTDIVVLRILG